MTDRWAAFSEAELETLRAALVCRLGDDEAKLLAEVIMEITNRALENIAKR